jgi:hypothetical protein
MQPSQMYALAVLERVDDDRRRAAQRRHLNVTGRATRARMRRRVLASLIRVPAADGR